MVRCYHTKDLDVKEICSEYHDRKTFDNVPIRKIMIANIDRDTTHKELKCTFSNFGKLTDCILKKQKTGKKSYAFITYATTYEASKALDAGYRKSISIDGQYLRVLPAAAWHQPDCLKNSPVGDEFVKVDDEETTVCNNYVVDDDAEVHKLNNDCLMHIFTYLPITDRIRIERVCKRWLVVSKEAWHSYRKLDLSPCKWELKTEKVKSGRSVKMYYDPVLAPFIYRVLSRCGPYITDIDLSQTEPSSHLSHQLGNATLITISKLCKNLRSINIRDFTFTSSGLKALANNCNNIRNLSIEHEQNMTTYDDELSLLFSKNRELRHLEINCNMIQGQCLLHLPLKSLQEMVLMQAHNGMITPLTKVMKHSKNTHIFRINYETHEINLQNFLIITKDICSYLSHVEVLEISFSLYTDLVESNDMYCLNPVAEFLINLKSLYMARNCLVNDEFLIKLSKNCKQLSNVDISDCRSATNRGLLAIASLPQLEHLVINDLNSITDEVLSDMPKLKTLHCSSCKNMHYVGLISLIRSSGNIELLDVSYCRFISNELIEAAMEATKCRTSKILTIMVSGTRVKMHVIKGSSPFLKVLPEG